MRLATFIFAIFFTLPLFTQNPADNVAYLKAHYDKRELMIPMRDGKRLFTAIYSPKDRSKKYPILMRRTPYACKPYGVDQFIDNFQNMYLAQEGYILVFQDVRGRYMSEGDFVDVRPAKVSKDGFDEATDSYDTAEWLLRYLSGHNGNIGVLGISYPGFYASMAAVSKHPAIKAVSPQAPVTDWFIGDDFHHNGALALIDAFDFYSGFGKVRPKPTMEGSPGFADYKTPDNYDFFLKAGNLRNLGTRFGMKDIPFWNDLMAHPNYDDFWKARDARTQLNGIKAAMLTVGGHFDAEDCWGAWNTYKALEKQNPQSLSNRIVVGPWIHGGWARTTGERLGNVSFGAKTGEYYLKEIELPFFEHYLKGKGQMTLPEACIFETGSNTWAKHEAWPPSQSKAQYFYFGPNGSLGKDKPQPVKGGKTADRYLSDPAHPVPYTENVHLKRTKEYMCDDQRFAARRGDVLTYETPVLSEAIALAGPIQAEFWVSLEDRGREAGEEGLLDADFVVKLIDVFPDTLQTVYEGLPLGGYQMLVRGEIFRGRFRESFEQPQPFKRGEVYRVSFELPDVAHRFLPGHRLMVQVQSTWFPLMDRNPQKYVPSIYEARDEDFIPLEIKIWREYERPSGIRVLRID
jgi:uncharacterized protein